jgi:hypothetical protein
MTTLSITEKRNLIKIVESNNEIIENNLAIMNSVLKENLFKFMWHTINGKYNKAKKIAENKLIENQYYINELYK